MGFLCDNTKMGVFHDKMLSLRLSAILGKKEGSSTGLCTTASFLGTRCGDLLVCKPGYPII